MDNLIKALFRKRDRDLVVMIMDPSDIGEPEEIRLQGKRQERWFTAAIIGSSVVGILLLWLILSRFVIGGDARLRQELNQLAGRVGALSDSVAIRDQQLSQIRTTLKGGEVNTTGVMPLQITNNRAPIKLPVSGRITRRYMPNSGHFGTDIAVKEGTALRNYAKGTVIGSDWTTLYGFVITVMHDDGHVMVYKHLITSSVRTGDILEEGGLIGTIGMAGTLSSGPHLHLELWKNGSHIDPMLYFAE